MYYSLALLFYCACACAFLSSCICVYNVDLLVWYIAIINVSIIIINYYCCYIYYKLCTNICTNPKKKGMKLCSPRRVTTWFNLYTYICRLRCIFHQPACLRSNETVTCDLLVNVLVYNSIVYSFVEALDQPVIHDCMRCIEYVLHVYSF